MQKYMLENWILGLNAEQLGDLGVGLALHRCRVGLSFCDVAEQMLGSVGDWSGEQALALIELGWVEWSKAHPGAVAKVVAGLWRDWCEQDDVQHLAKGKAKAANEVKFAVACIGLVHSEPRAQVMAQMRQSAAAAVVHGVEMWARARDEYGAAGQFMGTVDEYGVESGNANGLSLQAATATLQ